MFSSIVHKGYFHGHDTCPCQTCCITSTVSPLCLYSQPASSQILQSYILCSSSWNVPSLLRAGPAAATCVIAVRQRCISTSVTTSQGNFIVDQRSVPRCFWRQRLSSDSPPAPSMLDRNRTCWCFLTLLRVCRSLPLYLIPISLAISQLSPSRGKTECKLCTVTANLNLSSFFHTRFSQLVVTMFP